MCKIHNTKSIDCYCNPVIYNPLSGTIKQKKEAGNWYFTSLDRENYLSLILDGKMFDFTKKSNFNE